MDFARRESRSVVHQWRVANGIPITDPRFTEATEDDAILDLLITGMVRKAMNPDSGHDDAVRDPRFAKQLEDMQRAMSASDDLKRTLRAMMGRKRKSSVPLSLNVRSKVAKRARRVRP